VRRLTASATRSRTSIDFFRIVNLATSSSIAASEPLLAFDCAGHGCSAALLAGGEVRAHLAEARSRGHAERLLPLLEEVLAEAALGWEEIQRFAVTRGPGSFTGVRIGLATARGLALASGRPLFALDSFRLYAAMVRERLEPAAWQGRRLLVAIDTRRSDFFVQTFNHDGAADEARAVLPERLAVEFAKERLLLAGDGGARLLAAMEGLDIQLVPGCEMADSRTLARWATAQPAVAAASSAAPLYLRPPQVSFPKDRR